MKKSNEKAKPVRDANEHKDGKPENIHQVRRKIEDILADRAQRRLLE